MTAKRFLVPLIVVVALLVGWIGRIETAPTPTQPQNTAVMSAMAVYVTKTSTKIVRLTNDVQYLQNEVNNLESTVNCLERDSIVEGSVAINSCFVTNKWGDLPGSLP